MRANKISRWIDGRNRSLSLFITRKYYKNKEQGKPIPLLKPSFLIAIAQRFLLIAISLFRFNKALFAGYKWLSFRKFCRRLLGLAKFEIPGLLPPPESFAPLSFPASEHPEVSIVICVHNHIRFTYNCLLSILNNTRGVSYEVIIVNDCSTDDTAMVLAEMDNIVVIDNDRNIGFLKSCNKALPYCRGTYVCFLNNDTQVLSGWLANLIAPFQQVEKVGLVGAKLVYPYGLLQEAGGIVDFRGEPANYGKFDDTENVLYNYLRETDYCSGACLLVLKADLITLDGFDEAFSPAYYEDTDLAFRIRYRLNKKVYYQPLSQVVHFEGVSSGKISDGANVKSYQFVNAGKFRARWADVFRSFPQTTDAEAVARKFTHHRRCILIVEPLLPTFDQDSGSRRMFELIKLFLQLDWNVIFSPERKTQEEPYYSLLVNMGVWVLNKPVFQKSSKSVIRQVIPWIDVAWISRPRMNRRYGRFIKKKGIYWINDTVDIHFLRDERALEIGRIAPRKAKKVKRQKRMELSLLREADTVIAITGLEAKRLNSYGINNVAVVPNIHRPVKMELPGFEERQGLCFIGGFRHLPNVDAASWLVNDIMPLVWQKLPTVVVYLLGSLPTQEVLDLRSDRVHVPGYIPDVSPYFLSSRVFVAPLRFGAGMKGKIGQSFEFGLPVVTTDIGAEGMGLVDRKHYLRANTADEFAEAILELYHDNQLWADLSQGALAALEPYSVEQVGEKLKDILSRVH
ncbi:glycosyltransferase [Parapedobacter soli]|uniref:glycosyltransferase n=1 Tax=Parapedobacter soli TaxID=416955 RepID=UPI0021C68ABD|nr:glycosyltransferase [Parapedobacter soli]